MTYPKLPPVFKKKWLEALRSGKYKQGAKRLKVISPEHDISYCCLGLACIVMGHRPATISTCITGNSYPKVPNAIRFDKSKETVNKLTEMNDGMWSTRKRSFKQIANWIEKNL